MYVLETRGEYFCSEQDRLVQGVSTTSLTPAVGRSICLLLLAVCLFMKAVQVPVVLFQGNGGRAFMVRVHFLALIVDNR